MLLVLVAAIATGATARADGPSLGASLDRALRAGGIDPDLTAALAVDIRSGKVVYSSNADLPLRPASAEKLAVSFAALRLLGPSFRFRTEVVGDGRQQGRTWLGDVALVGHGDPSLTLEDLDALARDVAAWGIRRVVGRVLGDEQHFDSRRDAPGWKPSFLGIESRPLSALSIEEIPLRDANASAAAAASAFSRALGRHGVSVVGRPGVGRAAPDGISLAQDLSEPLKEIVRHMNRESDNFVAEMLLKELGASVARRGTTKAGAHAVLQALAEAHVRLRGVRIADGSGLSLSNRLSPSALVGILRAGADDPWIRDTFVDSLAVAGVSGTLEHRLERRPTRGRVIAKTGTTNAASALAGFIRRRYVFAIVQNGSPVPYWTARAAQDRFVTVLARS